MEVLATRVGMLLSRDQKRRKEERKPFFSMSTVRDSAAEGGAGRSRAEPGGRRSMYGVGGAWKALPPCPRALRAVGIHAPSPTFQFVEEVLQNDCLATF